ncbi:MAG TPA: ABC transporter permease [Myxococcaceae bacterium]|nr:ABC transporter permease [Myxococcaceae bacterium]
MRSLRENGGAAALRSAPARGRFSLRWPSFGWAQGLLAPAVLLVVWEAFSRAGVLPPNWIPAPTRILETLGDLSARGELARHIGATLGRVVIGFAIGASAGTVMGVLTGHYRRLRALFDPLLQGLRNIPSMAWAPLFLLWLGIQESSKVALIAVGVFFPVYLNTLGGILHIDRKLVEVGLVFEMRGIELFRRVLLPAMLPSWFVGLRGGLALGWMFVVAAEIMGASRGLGYLMVDGQMTSRPEIIIASIVLFAVMGKITDAALQAVGRRRLEYASR